MWRALNREGQDEIVRMVEDGALFDRSKEIIYGRRIAVRVEQYFERHKRRLQFAERENQKYLKSILDEELAKIRNEEKEQADAEEAEKRPLREAKEQSKTVFNTV